MSDSVPAEVLCIGFEPSGIGVGAHPAPAGIAIRYTAATDRETAKQFLYNPGRWDLLLVHSPAFYDLGVDRLLNPSTYALDASVIIIRAPASELSSAEAIGRGAADIVHHGDKEHLEAVMMRELGATAARKELRELRERFGGGGGFALPQIRDYGRAATARITATQPINTRLSIDDLASAGIPAAEALEDERIKGLIDRGGLTLEYQPIVPLRPEGTQRAAMFEALLRLRDEHGRLLSPSQFFPAAERHQWLARLDLWVFRRALPVLERIQADAPKLARLFVNLSTETLSATDTMQELVQTIHTAQIRQRSLTVEVRMDAISSDLTGLALLQQALSAHGHSLLLDHIGLADLEILREHAGWFRYIKLDPEIVYGITIGKRNTDEVSRLIRLAASHNIRVIALAVDSAKALPALYALGVDYIQGHFVSMPYEELVYPDVFSIDTPPKPQQ